jgi:CheY-like chemotaxis protein
VSGRVRQQIIVIEANDGAREMLRIEPTHEGHKVHEAAYGPTGVDGAAAVAPGAPLIDVGLSDLDDCDVARRMRAGKGEMSARLTATTGYGSAEDRRRAETGFDAAHLTKPDVSPKSSPRRGIASSPRPEE